MRIRVQNPFIVVEAKASARNQQSLRPLSGLRTILLVTGPEAVIRGRQSRRNALPSLPAPKAADRGWPVPFSYIPSLISLFEAVVPPTASFHCTRACPFPGAYKGIYTSGVVAYCPESTATKRAVPLVAPPLHVASEWGERMAGVQGFEPHLTDPESVVLPLNYTPIPKRRSGAERL